MNSGQADAGADELPNSGGNKTAASRRSAGSFPPYNSGLHKLVEGKQAWAEPLDDDAKAEGFLGWHQRGYLPHHDMPDATQLVTFRLNDAMPASRRSEWEALLRIEGDRERRTKLEEYLDRGLGECWLRQPRIADLVEGALRFFDGQRYRLGAWAVMPNHIHVLVEVWETPLARLLKSWKGFTARAANKLLGHEGAFWERDYWDTRIRDEQQLQKAVRYVEANPLKASLVLEAKAWQWSSARFQDEFGVLRMPQSNVGANGAQGGAPTSKSA